MISHYSRQVSFLTLISMLMLSAAAVYGAEESIVLTTYYPSPYGVYNEMRLYPHHPSVALCDKTQEGLMYYDDSPTVHTLKICMCKKPPACSAPSDFGWLPASGYWAASPFNPDNIYNTNSGNVGIGTNDPKLPLHVKASKDGWLMALQGPPDKFSAYGLTSDYITGWGIGMWGKSAAAPTTEDFGVGYYDGASWSTPFMIDKATGNVGIGTTNPGTNKLEVAGTAQLRGAVGGTGLYVDPSGNVGIGTTSPGASLHILGSPTVVSDRTLLVLDGGGSRDAAVYLNALGSDGVTANGIFESSAVGGHGGWTTEPEGIFLMAYKNNDINQKSRVRIIGNPITFEGDSVGIGPGLWNPGWLLHVGGDAAKPGGGSWTDSSDIRLKKNVAPLTDALEKVLQLRGVTFEWIEPEHAKLLPGTQIGMIGQEVEKVFPGWVGTDVNGYKDLTIRGFEALSVEAMRELKTENDALKARVDELEKRIKLLEAR